MRGRVRRTGGRGHLEPVALVLSLLMAASATACGKSQQRQPVAVGGEGGGAGSAGEAGAGGGGEATPLVPEGCSAPLGQRCERAEPDGGRQLAILPEPVAAFDASADQQVFAVCRSVYVQAQGGCVRELTTRSSEVLGVAIAGDAYLVVEARRLSFVNGAGATLGEWRSSSPAIGGTDVGPFVVQGGGVAFVEGQRLLQLAPPRYMETELALAQREIGALADAAGVLLWTEGARASGDVDVLVPDAVLRLAPSADAKPELEADRGCFELGSDGESVYCAERSGLTRWALKEAAGAEPWLPGAPRGLVVGPGWVVRGREAYPTSTPSAAVLSLPEGAHPLAVRAGAIYYTEPNPEGEGYALRAVTP